MQKEISCKGIFESLSKETPYNFFKIPTKDQLELIYTSVINSFGIVECMPPETIGKILLTRSDAKDFTDILIEDWVCTLDI